MKEIDQAVLARGCSSAASYAFLPYLPIWMMGGQAYGAGVIGTVVGLHIFALRAGGVFSRPAMQLVGRANALLACHLVAAATLALLIGSAFIGMATVPCLVALLALNGVATSVGNVLTKAFIASHAGKERRVHEFGKLNRAINGGAALGAVAGSVQMDAVPDGFAIISLLLFGLAAACSRGLPMDVVRNGGMSWSVRDLLGHWKVKAAFLAVTATIWLGYAQFFTALPVYAIGTAAQAFIGAFFAINAALIVTFQGKALRAVQPLLGGPLGPCRVFAGSAVLMVVALVGLMATHGALWPVLFAAIVIFTLSELLWAPLLDTWTASVFGQRHLVEGYTIAGLSWGLFEASGGALSIYYYAGVDHQGSVPWSYPILVTCLLVTLAGLGMRYVNLRPRYAE